MAEISPYRYSCCSSSNSPLSSLIRKPTCYQSHTPGCIDLILTDRKHLLQLSNIFETGLYDHHKLICTILKSGGFKGAPIEKIYRSYKTSDVDQFQEILKIKLRNIKNKRIVGTLIKGRGQELPKIESLGGGRNFLLERGDKAVKGAVDAEMGGLRLFLLLYSAIILTVCVYVCVYGEGGGGGGSQVPFITFRIFSLLN